MGNLTPKLAVWTGQFSRQKRSKAVIDRSGCDFYRFWTVLGPVRDRFGIGSDTRFFREGELAQP